MSGPGRKTGGAAPRLTLIERAAELYDVNDALRHGTPVTPVTAPARAEIPADASAPVPLPMDEIARLLSERAEATLRPTPVAPAAGDRPVHVLNRRALTEQGYIDAAGPATSLSEEFRIIKRQLLAQVLGGGAPRDRLVLVNSAHPGDGKTWMSINLALSLAAESDLEVLLVDADIGNPSICRQLALPSQPGLMDALVDPAVDAEALVVQTDIPALSILPAGRPVNNDTEVLASDHCRAVLSGLAAARPRRVVLFDSPPALAASAASELARHVGLVLMVVRADRTSDAALRDAVHLLSACPNIQAVLNGVKFSSSGRLFGAYYGKGTP